MDFETERIIDSNGQKYRVGWDEHGWFTIQVVELFTVSDASKDPNTVEIDGVEQSVRKVPSTLVHSFAPPRAKQLIEAIEEGLSNGET